MGEFRQSFGSKMLFYAAYNLWCKRCLLVSPNRIVEIEITLGSVCKQDQCQSTSITVHKNVFKNAYKVILQQSITQTLSIQEYFNTPINTRKISKNKK